MNNLPKNWTIATLNDVAKLTSGGTPLATKKEYYENGTIPWLVIGDLTDSFVECSEKYITEIALKESNAKLLPIGTLLIAMYGSIGKLGITKIECATNQAIASIIELYGIDKFFLFYLFLYKRPFLMQLGKGGTQKNISLAVLNSLEIPLPPLAEQGRIVAKIEELFAGIDAGVENLKSVKNQIALYRQSVLKSALDGTLYKTTEWNFTSIGTVCDINPKTVLPDFSDDSIVSFLPMPTVEAETGAFSPETVEYKKVKKGYTKFQNNDVLFAKITPCMENGKSCVVRDLIQGVGFGSTEFHVLRCHAGMLPEYVFYFVVQKAFRSKAISFMTGAVGQKRVPADYLRDCEIPVPTLAEQERIVAEIESRFERADALETAVDRALNDAEKLKQAVLKKAFSGELVPQNPDDEPASVLLDRIRAARASELPAKKENGNEWIV